MNIRLEDLEKSWELTRCMVMSNGWIDGKCRTLINLLIHCPRGTMFIESVDASTHVKDVALLLMFLLIQLAITVLLYYYNHLAH
jgi:hypothetical protein